MGWFATESALIRANLLDSRQVMLITAAAIESCNLPSDIRSGWGWNSFWRALSSLSQKEGENIFVASLNCRPFCFNKLGIE
jgi:hypothetical protein